MKIIFLDVDGVLNKFSTKERVLNYYFVEDRKVKYLKELVETTGAKIVLSSTWRNGWHCIENGRCNSKKQLMDIQLFEALRDKLQEYGLELMSHTEEFGLRGEEIDKWLSEWQGEPIEEYVILDDINPIELQSHSQHLIQTTFEEGLQPKHIRKAVKMLNSSSKK